MTSFHLSHVVAAGARWGRALERFLERRDALPQEQYLDVTYEEIVASPVGTIERIYRHLGKNYDS